MNLSTHIELGEPLVNQTKLWFVEKVWKAERLESMIEVLYNIGWTLKRAPLCCEFYWMQCMRNRTEWYLSTSHRPIYIIIVPAIFRYWMIFQQEERCFMKAFKHCFNNMTSRKINYANACNVFKKSKEKYIYFAYEKHCVLCCIEYASKAQIHRKHMVKKYFTSYLSSCRPRQQPFRHISLCTHQRVSWSFSIAGRSRPSVSVSRSVLTVLNS